jgi:hypothetical protein
MDEQEELVVEEEMTDTAEESNQDEQETTETGERETELAETSEAEEETEAESEEESTSGQENAMQASKRRERERREEAMRQRIERESYQKGLIDAVGGKNPYTNEPIQDAVDVEEYLLMREIEKNGGDPVMDYAKTLKSKQKERHLQAETQSKSTEVLENFKKAYPNVDLGGLLADERFALFAGKRISGGEALSDVYKDYLSFTGRVQAQAEKSAEIKVKNQQAKSNASPGSLTGGGDIIKLSYADMSEEAFEKKLNKVLRGEERI